jgi:DNA repair protein RecN (Recombination protein N)
MGRQPAPVAQPAGLLSLRIQNYALIDELRVEFGTGLNVLTGETGTGKSIILGALSLLLGDRPDPDMIRSGADSAAVEGTFAAGRAVAALCAEVGIPVETGQSPLLVLRRRIGSAGRNAAWANDTSITVATLARLGDRLIDLHGQHQHQLLLDSEFQLSVLDEYAGLGPDRSRFADRFAEHERLVAELAALDRDIRERTARRELTEFQLKELDAAAVRPGEADELRREQEFTASAEKRWQLVAGLRDLLSEREGSLTEGLAAAGRSLTELAALDPVFADWRERVAGAQATVDDLWRELVQYGDATEYSPERTEQVNARLFLIEKLERKHSVPAAELPALEAKLRAELDLTATDPTRRDELAGRQAALLKQLGSDAAALSRRRARAAKQLEAALPAEFATLGLDRARVDAGPTQLADESGLVELDGRRFRLTDSGIDAVEFRFSANPGEDLRPLRKVASGGEISRVMLAIKSCLSASDPVGTLVFDEVDSGIGGRVAEAVGLRLRRLGAGHQVICITHLPQIAKYAARHFVVSKASAAGRTATGIRPLDDEGRVRELARMAAGAKVTATGVAHARELIAEAGRNCRD